MVAIATVAISIYRFVGAWPLITCRLLIATALIPLVAIATSATVCLVFRQSVPRIKAVGVAVTLQNTLLTSAIIQVCT